MQSPSSICSLVAKRFLLVSRKELYDWRFPFAVLDLDEGQTFRAEFFCDRGQFVDLTDRDAGESFRVDRFDDAARIERTAKHLESAFAKDVAQINQSHAKTAIRFVAAEGANRFAIGQAIERRFDFDAARRFENRGQHSFGQSVNVFRPNE